MIKVNIKKIHKACPKSIDMLNSLSLWDMEFYKDNEVVHIPDENIREWQDRGGSNLRFIEHVVKHRRYLIMDIEEERGDEDEVISRQDPVFIHIKKEDDGRQFYVKPRGNMKKYFGRFRTELLAREFCRINNLLCDLFVVDEYGHLV